LHGCAGHPGTQSIRGPDEVLHSPRIEIRQLKKMKPSPQIPIPIDDILQTTEDAVLVLLAGRREWIPRAHVQFAAGHMIVPVWMADKIRRHHVPTD